MTDIPGRPCEHPYSRTTDIALKAYFERWEKNPASVADQQWVNGYAQALQHVRSGSVPTLIQDASREAFSGPYERQLLGESLQWLQTLRAVYRHRGNAVMADSIHEHITKVEALFPSPSNVMLEQASEPCTCQLDQSNGNVIGGPCAACRCQGGPTGVLTFAVAPAAGHVLKNVIAISSTPGDASSENEDWWCAKYPDCQCFVGCPEKL